MRTAVAGAALAIFATCALAEAPATSPRPEARPGAASVPVAPAPGAMPERPRARPASEATVGAAVPAVLPGDPSLPVGVPPAPADDAAAGREYLDLLVWGGPVPGQPTLAAVPVMTTRAATKSMPQTALTAPPLRPAAVAPSVRPRSRPGDAPSAVAPAVVVPAGAAAAAPSPLLVTASLRPAPRPARLAAAAAAQRQETRRTAPQPERVQPAAIIRPAPGADPVRPTRGALCGDARIRGEAVNPIVGRIRGCGIAEPVRVTEVAGVRLSQAALMDCPTARALTDWVERGVKPAVGGKGGGVARLEVAAHYVCRTRNHRKGAPLSEHAKGRAIDISGITLANGQTLSVLRDWRKRAEGRVLKAAHRAACGIFGTTLGPGSDGMHEDHFHFDILRHRGGPYCR